MEQFYLDNSAATGVTKDNEPSDPNYVSPVYDDVTCDFTVDAFEFEPVEDALLSTDYESNTVTPTGFTVPVRIQTFSNFNFYSINGGGFTSEDGILNPGETLTMKQQSSPDYETTRSAPIKVSQYTTEFLVTTMEEPFTFDTVDYAETETTYASEIYTHEEDGTVPVEVTSVDGEYRIRIGGVWGAWTSADGTISVGQSLQVRQTSAVESGTTKTVSFQVGDQLLYFNVKTYETVPVMFDPIFNVTAGSLNESSIEEVTGITDGALLMVSGSDVEYNKNGEGWVNFGGTINNTDTIQVRRIASNDPLVTLTAGLTIGSFTTGFNITTEDV